jgi:hypothetical protein
VSPTLLCTRARTQSNTLAVLGAVTVELGGKEYAVPFGTPELRSTWTQAHRAAMEDRAASPLADS